jgi:hypothetical protein
MTTLVLELNIPPDQGVIGAAEIAAAFGVPDDGSDSIELGRPETGSSCLIQRSGPGASPADRWALIVPTIRAPWSARDLLPACAEAVAGFGGDWGGARTADELVARWDAAHARDVARLGDTCLQTGAPPPPYRERALVDRVHEGLVALASSALPAPPTIHALDPGDGQPTSFAVRLPVEHERFWLPHVDGVLWDRGRGIAGVEEPRFFSLGLHGELERETVTERLRDVEGEAIDRYRVVTPVEVVDAESLPTA